MSDSSDTSVIDNKKEKSKSTGSNLSTSNLKSFIYSILILFIAVILYYISSGLILYACKLAQSNILPTDFFCYPYKETKPNIEPIQTNIFTNFTSPQLSMKLNFPYDKYNSENKLLDMFREYKNGANSNFLANYFISIIEAIIQFNYSVLNFVLNSLNGMPELLIVVFGPIIISVVSTILFICDHLYLIYLWFANMSWFFKKNINSKGIDSSNWKDVTFIDLFDYLFGFLFVFLFFILFFFSLPLLSIIAVISLSWCLLSCINYKSQIDGKNTSLIFILQEFFKFYKILIMGIISVLVVSATFSSFGVVPGIFSLITFILICFGFVAVDIFKPITLDNLSPMVSLEQAKKTCNFIEPIKKKHDGLLYNLLFGQKGGNITKELKNIKKKSKLIGLNL